jgi:hypothetical protein
MSNYLEYAKVKVSLECMEKAILPDYLGSTLRGVLGIELKKCTCTEDIHKLCKDCENKYSCAYTFFFNHIEQNIETNGQKTLPNSFIIEPPLMQNKTSFEKGELLEFNIVFIGENTQFIPLFIHALEGIAENGLGARRKSFRLTEIDDYSTGLIIYTNEEFYPENLKIIKCSDDTKFRKVIEIKISFKTPFRFKNQGKISDGLNFELFMRNIFRRASSLSELYCNKHWELDYKSILEEARNITVKKADFRWHDWQRYSSTHRDKISMGGIIGDIIFAGDLEKFLPYIHIGSIIHIGKGCTFGMGAYTYEI